MQSCDWSKSVCEARRESQAREPSPWLLNAGDFLPFSEHRQTPWQLTDGHISKHCFMEGLECGNKSAGEREYIQTQERKKVDAGVRSEVSLCDMVCMEGGCTLESYIYIRKVYCKLH